MTILVHCSVRFECVLSDLFCEENQGKKVVVMTGSTTEICNQQERYAQIRQVTHLIKNINFNKPGCSQKWNVMTNENVKESISFKPMRNVVS